MPLSPPSEPLSVTLEPLVNRVYRMLFDAILTHDLAPGEGITEVDIADTLGVSRTPVREAFRRLADDGLVVIEPNRGTHVTRIDAEFIREAGEVIATLCGMAAGLAAPHLSEADLTCFSVLERDFAAQGERDPSEPVSSRVSEFIDVLVERSEQGVLQRTIGGLRPHLQRLLYGYGNRVPVTVITDRLSVIVSAARAKDSEMLSVAVRSFYTHINQALLQVHLASQDVAGADTRSRTEPLSTPRSSGVN